MNHELIYIEQVKIIPSLFCKGVETSFNLEIFKSKGKKGVSKN
jgi:hypothetical protein